jgi:hypothetical protein
MTHFLRRLALIVSCVALAGCGGGSGGNRILTAGGVRAVNTIADSPALEVRLGNGSLGTVAFAQSSALSDAITGPYEVTVQYTPPGGALTTVLRDRDLEVEEDRQKTLVLLGTLAQATLLVLDEAEPAVAAGQSEVHFVHGATAIAAVDFYLTEATVDIATVVPTVSVNRGAASNLATLPSGDTYRLRVTTAGTKDVVYDSGAFALASTVRRLFVLTDYFGPGGAGVRAIVVGNSTATIFANEALPAQFRVANLVADLAAVDVYVGAVAPPPLYAALAEGTVSDPELAAPATLTVNVTPESDASTIVHSGSLPLAPGQARTLVVGGVDGDGSVFARAIPDLVRPIAGLAQLRVVQASPAAGNVDFHLLATGSTPSLTSADLRSLALQSSGEVTSQPGTFDAFFTAAASTTVVVGPVPVTVAAGGLYTLFLADLVGGGSPPRVIPADDFLE